MPLFKWWWWGSILCIFSEVPIGEQLCTEHYTTNEPQIPEECSYPRDSRLCVPESWSVLDGIDRISSTCPESNSDNLARSQSLQQQTYQTKKKTSVALVSKRTIRPSDRRLSAKLMPTFADRGCRVVRATDPHGRILGFLDRSHHSQ
jgi:hypothetical protein